MLLSELAERAAHMLAEYGDVPVQIGVVTGPLAMRCLAIEAVAVHNPPTVLHPHQRGHVLVESETISLPIRPTS